MINGLGIVGWGVGRHRGRGGYARPAGLFSYARRGRCTARWRITAGSDRVTDLVLRITEMLSKGQGRRQVRRVLRIGCRFVERYRPRDDREYGARIRSDDGYSSGSMRRPRLFPRNGPDRGADRARSETTTGAGMFGIPGEGEVDYSARSFRSTPGNGHAQRSPGRNVRRTALSCRASTTGSSSSFNAPVPMAGTENWPMTWEKRYAVSMCGVPLGAA